MRIILFISSVVLLVTCIAFLAYEYNAFKENSLQKLSTVGRVIATNSTAALAFSNQEDAKEILSALRAEPHIVAACLYDQNRKLFAIYPDSAAANTFPSIPLQPGYHFTYSYLDGFEPVVQGSHRLGTLYLKSDLTGIYSRLRLFGITALIVIVIVFLLAYLLSDILQKSISKPIVDMAETAKAISQRGDYSVRFTQMGKNELGLLTDAFNQLLAQIEYQNKTLSDFNQQLEHKITERTEELAAANRTLESNIDRLKESEERFSKIFESSPVGISIGELPSGIIVDANKSFLQMTGFSREEVVEHTSAELKMIDAVERGKIKTELSERGRIKDKEIVVQKKSGEKILTLLSLDQFSSGGIKYAITIIYDISERKKAEEQIAAVNKELESFSYSVSHDLRAPLRSVNGYARMLSKNYGDKLDEEATRVINNIVHGAKRMGQLIDDLLSFSRLGRKELVKTQVSVSDMVTSTWDELKVFENNRDIIFTVKELPNTYADSVTLKQVWMNLISNALKYSRLKDKTIIEVGAEVKPDETTYYIKDNGAGFDMRFADKLFGVFQRLHTEAEFEGTGVGLAIVHRIIDRHGGRIWAESKVNVGTQFFFSLPNKN